MSRGAATQLDVSLWPIADVYDTRDAFGLGGQPREHPFTSIEVNGVSLRPQLNTLEANHGGFEAKIYDGDLIARS